MKRVILFVIDALTSPLLLNEMENGRYPHFQKLKEAGTFRPQCISIFPSITHAALSSIATGKYPAEHGIIGSHWYDIEKDKVVYYSGGLNMVRQKGFGTFFRELLLDLNNEYLASPTIFQLLERDGYKTANINFLVYKGDVEHEIEMPLMLKWLPDLPASTTIKGAKELLLGDLLFDPNNLDVKAAFRGASYWFGFHDKNTIDLVLQMAQVDEFPDFTLAYFPENDQRAHEDGPIEAHKNLMNLDAMLGHLFEIYGGLDAFLEQFTLVVTGDHSQSETAVFEDEEAINLAEILSDYQVAEGGNPWQADDEIMACPNLRSAVLYLKNKATKQIEDVILKLLAEPRIDQVIYRAELLSADDGYVVQTANGRLRFWSAVADGTTDRYGNRWQWEGDLAVVNGRLQNNTLIFPDYPNAFERITGVLNAPASGQLWVTAKLGCELMIPHVEVYNDGGSHAALHRLDSEPPLFVAGAPAGVEIPEFPRIIDIAPLCRAFVTNQ